MIGKKSPRILQRRQNSPSILQTPASALLEARISSTDEAVVLPVDDSQQMKFRSLKRARMESVKDEFHGRSSSQERESFNNIDVFGDDATSMNNYQFGRRFRAQPPPFKPTIIQLKMGLDDDEILLRGGVAFHRDRNAEEKRTPNTAYLESQIVKGNSSLAKKIKEEKTPTNLPVKIGIAEKAGLYVCSVCRSQTDQIFIFTSKNGLLNHARLAHFDVYADIERSANQIHQEWSKRVNDRQNQVMNEIRKQGYGNAAESSNLLVGEAQQEASLPPPGLIRVLQRERIEEYPKECTVLLVFLCLLRIPVFQRHSDCDDDVSSRVVCIECGAKIESKEKSRQKNSPYAAHIRVHLVSNELLENFGTEVLSSWGFVCEYCKLAFPSQHNVKTHINSVHLESSEAGGSAELAVDKSAVNDQNVDSQDPHTQKRPQQLSTSTPKNCELSGGLNLQKCQPISAKNSAFKADLRRPPGETRGVAYEIPVQRVTTLPGKFNDKKAVNAKGADDVENSAVHENRSSLVALLAPDTERFVSETVRRLLEGCPSELLQGSPLTSLTCPCTMSHGLCRPELVVRHMARCHSTISFSANLQLSPLIQRIIRFTVAPTGKVTWNCCSTTFPSSTGIIKHWKEQDHFTSQTSWQQEGYAEPVDCLISKASNVFNNK